MIREDVLLRAKSGDSESQAIAAYFYYKDADYDNAANWAKAAADQNNSKGLYLLGIMHWNGLSVTRDTATATDLLRRAAKLGNNDARKVLEQKGLPVEDEQEPEVETTADNDNAEKESETEEKEQEVESKDATEEQNGVDRPAPIAEVTNEGEEQVDIMSDVEEKQEDDRQPLTPERLKELKAQAKAESEKLKRKKMRKRIDRRKRGLKVFGKILLVIAILIAAVIVFFAAIYFIPFKGQRGVWNKYCTSIWFSDYQGVKGSLYFPTEEAEKVFDESYSDGSYFKTFPFVIGLMTGAEVSEDGNTATADAFVFYIYNSSTYHGMDYFHHIKLDFVKDENDNWYLSNEYPLPRLG